MLLATRPLLKDRNLSINGKEALKDVPENIVVMPLTDTSAFVGATSPHASSRHVFKLGVIKDVRLLCLFRFKLWWMIPRTGSSASDIPLETQMLLLKARQGPTSSQSTYIIFLPVLDGNFRSSLQGNSSDELEFCVKSGDPAVVTSESPKAVFVNYGDHPFDLVKDSMMILEKQFGTFALRETKQTPGMLDWFGWCTWDAFYSDVNPQGIKDGLMSLSQGGTPARFLLIDDGWQDTINEFLEQGEPFVDGLQFRSRLANIKENKKFRRIANEANSKTPSDLKEFISDIRTFDLKYVYVWHALLGCWGGLVPNAVATKNYDPKLRYPILSPVYLANMRDISMDSMGKYGICLVDPDKISQFYDDLHGYLASQDVDGVKVDAQNILETISAGLGGRVSLTRRFQQALEGSIAANFSDNSIICCMAQSTDSIYHLKQSAVSRASDDFYPKEPTTWARHVAAVAFNSILHGELVVPDWDMFYAWHDILLFIFIPRAVGGCGVYVCDKPGRHDFKILQRLVLPDGSVLRAKYPGRPSRDCLFTDPVTDGKSLLKIWNLNKCTGVIGIFNCQGSWPVPSTNKAFQMVTSSELSGQVSPACVEYLEEVIGLLWTGECAVFSFKTGGVSR
ncbi:hypothetical protein E1A91_D05G191500v1 [Gossypium mustelinum]|uniref:galactinol--sucrose galactosyltransferase n=1 Tax=Gossypium mustelinum TaxID=34275 RepID=A0A5D2UY71_GOSMU|nr:hypothetical protein E1A91_D05G191500v1 [Gossypium mustelinum]